MNTLPPPIPPSAPAAAGRPKPPAKTIGIFAAVAVVAAGGTFLVTRGDDPQTVAPAATTTTVAITTPPPTTVPVIVEPSTTVATAPESTAPPVTVPATVVIPAGATDLGYGVYVPTIDGVEVTGDGPFTFSNSTGGQTIAQVLSRDYSEDPNDLIKEYLDTWDADYDNVVYSLSAVYEPGYLDHANLRLAQVFYAIHQPGEAPLGGVVSAVVRNDGLSLLTDQWGDGDGVLTPAYDEMIASVANAPALGEPHDFAPAVQEVPDNSRPTVDIPFVCMCQVVPTPGFTVSASNATSVTLVNGNSQLILQRIEGMNSPDQVQQTATQLVRGLVPSATFDPFAEFGAQLPSYFADWNSPDGIGAHGGVWMLYDEDAHAMLIAISSTIGHTDDPTALSFMVAGFAWRQWTIN